MQNFKQIWVDDVGHSGWNDMEWPNYDARKFFFCNRVVEVLNTLPDRVVLSGSINIFKNNLDEYFIKESCYYNYEAVPYGLL